MCIPQDKSVEITTLQISNFHRSVALPQIDLGKYQLVQRQILGSKVTQAASHSLYCRLLEPVLHIARAAAAV